MVTNWSDDELSDDEYPDDDAYEEDDESLTVRCPECGADVYEDAEQCPECGNYITASTNPWQGRSLIWIGLGLLGVVALLWALVVGG